MQSDDGFFVLVLGVLAAVLTIVVWWHIGATPPRDTTMPRPLLTEPTPPPAPTPAPTATPLRAPTPTATPIPTVLPAPAPTATAVPSPTPEPPTTAEIDTALDTLVAESPIEFAVGSARLTDGSRATLELIVEQLQTASVDLIVVGHTDDRGDPLQNAELSLERARSVVNHLVANGVDEARLRADGRGGSEPIADNDTEAGRAANRRIEFVVVDTGD